MKLDKNVSFVLVTFFLVETQHPLCPLDGAHILKVKEINQFMASQ